MIGGLCQAPRYSSSVSGFGSFCACGWLPAGLEPGTAFPVTSRHRRCRVAPRGSSAAVHGLVTLELHTARSAPARCLVTGGYLARHFVRVLARAALGMNVWVDAGKKTNPPF